MPGEEPRKVGPFCAQGVVSWRDRIWKVGRNPYIRYQPLKLKKERKRRDWDIRTCGAHAFFEVVEVETQGEWDERLASFLANHIRTHTSPIYGDGFRAALDAFQNHGLPAVLASVRATGALPL